MGKLYTSVALAVLITLSGCTSNPTISDSYQQTIATPENWQVSANTGDVAGNWLAQLHDPQIQALVKQAIENNKQLKQQSYQLAISKEQLTLAGADLWPGLDAGLSSRRNKSQTANYGKEQSISLDFSYELDVWGKLSDNDRKANLNYLASQATFSEQTQQLVANVVLAWFKVIEANAQLALVNERVALATQNLEIIESGYKQGLNSALDVYLTRNEFNSEKSRLAQQRETQLKAIRNLELLVGDYPAGDLTVSQSLPLLESDIPLGIPSELVSRKPSLQASWYQLLSADANLAYAHKQRFPSLRLTAKLGRTSEEFSDLLSGRFAWSLLGNLTAPIFDAGTLKARESIARLELKQKEQLYLDALQQAFANVENGISSETSLQQRYQATLEAAENAKLAETLSFEQYLKGLVSYTTVLDAQKRSFDAQSSLISIKSLLISNRVNLHLALGGDFASPEFKG